MVVDFPANNDLKKTATKALFPDDPSNVYHSYLGDHVQFRILHAGANITPCSPPACPSVAAQSQQR